MSGVSNASRITLMPQTSQLEAIRNVNRLRRILEATKLLNSTIDLAELTRIILKIVREEMHIDRATVYVVDRERRQIRSIVAPAINPPYLSKYRRIKYWLSSCRFFVPRRKSTSAPAIRVASSLFLSIQRRTTGTSGCTFTLSFRLQPAHVTA